MKSRKLLWVVVLWSLLKIIRAGFGMQRSESGNFIRKVLEGVSFNQSDKWNTLLFMIIFLVCEIIPFIMVLDGSLVSVFQLEARRDDSLISVVDTNAENEEDDALYISSNSDNSPISKRHVSTINNLSKLDESGNNLHIGRRYSIDSDKNKPSRYSSTINNVGGLSIKENFEDLTLSKMQSGFKNKKSKTPMNKRYIRRIKDIIVTDKRDFQILDEYLPEQVHKQNVRKVNMKFGKLYEAKLKNENCICRKIQFDRLTSYMTEDLYDEIQITNHICDDSIVKIKALFIEKSDVYLFYPRLTSLYDYLHVQKVKLSNREKHEIAVKISGALKMVHECGSAQIHGHLSSKNLFIEKVVENNTIQHKILIGDIGDMSIRQHAKIFMDYEIRNT
jgi:hypothetical protein